MRQDAFAAPIGSLWEASAPPDPADGPLLGDHRADVCIVGAGFTGLSAALSLASAGVSVVVLDSGGSGFGASGRNGGQVLPGLKWDPDELVAKYGAERGERITAFAGAAPDRVYRLVEAHAITCGLHRNCGWLNAAVDDSAFARQASRAQQWARRGAAVRAIESAETRDMLGTVRYRGALLDQRAGALNPLAYVRGLTAAAQRFQAQVHGNSQVVSLAREQGRWRASTRLGSVSADTVLLCTNGYTDLIWPGLAHAIIPIHSLQVATAPLPDPVRATVLPKGQVVSDTQRILLYFRLDDDGRLIMGGRGSLGNTNRDALFRFVEDAACWLFPQIGKPRWQFRWAGQVALTTDHLPHVHKLAPGVLTCLGYNGRGVAMATAMGQALAEWVRTGDDDAVPLLPTPMRALPFHGLRRPALEVISAYFRLRDRMAWRARGTKEIAP
jgi:glycine/D-amino acid oxidase-like deaminating enzyme